MPQQPLSRTELQEKFNTLTASIPAENRARVFTQLAALETVGNVQQLQLG
jgi:hypothetical protein